MGGMMAKKSKQWFCAICDREWLGDSRPTPPGDHYHGLNYDDLVGMVEEMRAEAQSLRGEAQTLRTALWAAEADAAIWEAKARRRGKKMLRLSAEESACLVH